MTTLTPKPRPSCFDCVRAHVTSGYPGTYYVPPEYPEATCTLDDDPEGDAITEELTEIAASGAAQCCPGFSPYRVDVCSGCNADLDVPQWSHTLWGDAAYGRVPVCSAACAAAVTAETAEFERQALLWEMPE